jgi:hypothetical protein
MIRKHSNDPAQVQRFVIPGRSVGQSAVSSSERPANQANARKREKNS